MRDVMIALGDYRFSLDTAAYDALTRETGWRWPPAESIGGRPIPQYLGPGAEKIELSGTIFPSFRSGLGQLDEMRAEAEKGKPLHLVDGHGIVRGRYVITRVMETQSMLGARGEPKEMKFVLELHRYGGAQ